MLAKGLKRKFSEVEGESDPGSRYPSALPAVQSHCLMNISLVKLHRSLHHVEPNLRHLVLVANTLRRLQAESGTTGGKPGEKKDHAPLSSQSPAPEEIPAEDLLLSSPDLALFSSISNILEDLDGFEGLSSSPLPRGEEDERREEDRLCSPKDVFREEDRLCSPKDVFRDERREEDRLCSPKDIYREEDRLCSPKDVFRDERLEDQICSQKDFLRGERREEDRLCSPKDVFREEDRLCSPKDVFRDERREEDRLSSQKDFLSSSNYLLGENLEDIFEDIDTSMYDSDPWATGHLLNLKSLSSLSDADGQPGEAAMLELSDLDYLMDVLVGAQNC